MIMLTAFFFIIRFVIILQYLNFGVWFQLEDILHESFALFFFSLALEIVIGSNFPKKLDFR
jgi:hypothetical protein